jgi:hypothetical protein
MNIEEHEKSARRHLSFTLFNNGTGVTIMVSPFNLSDIIAVNTFHIEAHLRGYYTRQWIMDIQRTIRSNASLFEGNRYPKEIIMLRSTTI